MNQHDFHCSRRTVPSFNPPGYPKPEMRTKVGSIIRVCRDAFPNVYEASVQYKFLKVKSFVNGMAVCVEKADNGRPIVVRSWVTPGATASWL